MPHYFDEPTPLNDVAEFHSTYDLPVTNQPEIPPAKRCELRINLLQEELNELKEAIKQNDIVEAADAFCDIQYVLSGAILEFGLAPKFKELFEEVHRSNMSKVCKSPDEAQETQEHYIQTKNTPSIVKERNGEYLVYRTSDGKVLKSVNYSEAELQRLL